MPPTSLATEPAASLEDVEAAIKRCNPWLVFFSGHSFAGYGGATFMGNFLGVIESIFSVLFLYLCRT